jgi:hypothetical protein
LSSLAKTDFYNTNVLLDSTRNAPKRPYATNECHIYADDVYAMSEDSSDDRQHKKAKKSVPTNLTPVTIMVVDTISAVRSKKLLKVLLDSGSTTTLINNKCLPKHCKPCSISSSRKVNTLTGTYTSTEVVTIRNLRLPEFDKNRNVDQQKASYFSQRLVNIMSF